MNTSEQLDQIAPALIAAQQEFSNPKKNTKGHHYNYATLDQVIDCVVPVLNEHGIMLTQHHVPSEPGFVGLTTTLLHTSGQFIESTMMIPMESNKSMSACQQYGSASTYARRYAIQAAAGLCAEADTDAHIERVNYKQGKVLTSLFEQLPKSSQDAALAHYQITAITDLPEKYFDKAVEQFKTRIAQQQPEAA